MAKPKHSELLELLNQRKAWAQPQVRAPRWSDKDKAAIEAAATLHAKAFASDPFAYARIKNEMFRNLDNPTAVSEAASRLLAARDFHKVLEAA